MLQTDRLTAYKMLWPAVVIEAALVLTPLAVGFWYSLNNVRFFRIRNFVGLDN